MLIFVISDCYLVLNYITSEVGNLPQQLPTGDTDVETCELRIDVLK